MGDGRSLGRISEDMSFVYFPNATESRGGSLIVERADGRYLMVATSWQK